MNVERIDCAVPTRAPTGKTACYLVGGENALLVDPAAEDGRIDDRLGDVAAIAVTHHHPDHVGAVEAYADETDATVWCRSGREAAFEGATGVEPDRTFREGTVIETDEGTVSVRETPGHAPEHAAFRVGEDVLVGDLAVADGSVFVGTPEGDMRAYLTSLRRLWARAPDRLLPAHGPPIDDPRACCRRLLDHRLAREKRVLAAVEAGNRTVGDILQAAYEKDLTGIEDLAELTVRAHLRKLHREGRIRWEGSRAVPV